MDEQSHKNEVVGSRSKIPSTFKTVHEDLGKNFGSWSYAIVASAATVIGLVLSVLFGWVDMWLGALSFLAFLSVVVFIFHSARVNHEYFRYATWIFENVPPKNEELKLRVTYNDEHGRKAYAAHIKNKEDEEIYDVQAIRPYPPASALVDASQKAKVFRDPLNLLAVVACVGETRIWLREHLPSPLNYLYGRKEKSD